jgi:hypothetical protein
MPGFTDALRGYALATHKRDGWKCVYCGLDGRESFGAWLSLSWEHLLPKGHPRRDHQDFIVTSCMFCNVCDNRYFDRAKERGVVLDGKTPQELIDQRRPYVVKTRDAYRAFWETNVMRT